MNKHSIFLLFVLLFGSLVLPFSAMAENNDTKPQSNSETTIVKEDFQNENQPENVAIQIDSTLIEDVDNLFIDYFPKKTDFPCGLKACVNIWMKIFIIHGKQQKWVLRVLFMLGLW